VAESTKVLLDLNNPIFQSDLFNLGKKDLNLVFGTFRNLKQLTWTEIYSDKGLRWELVQSKKGPGGSRLYTIRLSERLRALVYREEQFMRFLSLHPDHDSAYR
jgi:hypothetical protein